jgi:hypothetical protein
MYVVKVKDRGRDLVTHQTERLDEARELARVYELIGYPRDKVLVDKAKAETSKAA